MAKISVGVRTGRRWKASAGRKAELVLCWTWSTGYLNWNMHEEDQPCDHSPVLVAANDVVKDKKERWDTDCQVLDTDGVVGRLRSGLQQRGQVLLLRGSQFV